MDLIPSLVQAHGHGADERLHPGSGLIVGGPKSSANSLVVQHRHFKREVLAHVLDNHHEERKFDSERLILFRRARNVRRAHIGSFHLKNARLNVLVRQSLDVSVFHLGRPDLKRLAPATQCTKEKRCDEYNCRCERLPYPLTIFFRVRNLLLIQERFAHSHNVPDRVKDGQKSTLKGIFEHILHRFERINTYLRVSDLSVRVARARNNIFQYCKCTF